jgi:hypothetical protein
VGAGLVYTRTTRLTERYTMYIGGGVVALILIILLLVLIF